MNTCPFCAAPLESTRELAAGVCFICQPNPTAGSAPRPERCRWCGQELEPADRGNCCAYCVAKGVDL